MRGNSNLPLSFTDFELAFIFYLHINFIYLIKNEFWGYILSFFEQSYKISRLSTLDNEIFGSTSFHILTNLNPKSIMNI